MPIVKIVLKRRQVIDMGTRLQKTEYQVVECEGDNVLYFEKLKEAKKEFDSNKDATELRKVLWRCHENETWESDDCTDENQRVETIIATRKAGD